MSTINSILNSSILLEAVRINNGKEAFELIKTNKLGVKLDPSYKIVDENIIPYLDKAINNVGVNNAAFTIQLLANKVPVEQLKEVVDSDALKEIISCKNKPWAKEIPGYKETIDFSSKEKYDSEKWHDLEKALQEEGQKHGKKSKGSGDSGEVKTVYDDGTWSLQIPKSFNGAKAASFYGKKDETPKPTGWCTRTNERYYNDYTRDNTKPLYIIRNMENGKAYQMAIRGRDVDFLDQDDVRGDEITKGDFTNIPDELLKKIPYGEDESMLDFKQAFSGASQELKDYKKNLKKLKASSNIKDPTDNPRKAVWGKTERVTAKISKNVFLNYYASDNPPKLENPLSKVRGFNSATFPKKLKSSNNADDKSWNSEFITGNKINNYNRKEWAAKYYYNDDPNNFIIIRAKSKKDIKSIKPELRVGEYQDRDRYDAAFLDEWPEVGEYSLATNYDFVCYAYDRETNKIKKVKDIHRLWDYSKHNPKTLAIAALKDFGGEKTYRRNVEATEKKRSERAEKVGEKILYNNLCNGLSSLLNKVFPRSGKWSVMGSNIYVFSSSGKIIPHAITDYNDNYEWMDIKNNQKDEISIVFYKKSTLHHGIKKIKFCNEKFPERSQKINDIVDNYGREKLEKEIEKTLDNSFKSYMVEAIKNKDIKVMRMISRMKGELREKEKKTSERLQFEDYFPY